MVLASDLLDLSNATSLSFADVGGLDGLVKAGAFKDKQKLLDLLNFLDGYTLPDEDANGYIEGLDMSGFHDTQVQAVVELGLVEYRYKDYVPLMEELNDSFPPPDTIGWFELTDLGKSAVAEGKQTG